MANKIAREVAEAEVTKWLDDKRIQPSQREANEEQVKTLIDSFCDGVLVREESSGGLIHNLIWPLEGESTFISLKYRFRMNDKDLVEPMKGVSPKDGDARMTAYISAVSNAPKGIIRQLDPVDKRVALAVTIFFLPG